MMTLWKPFYSAFFIQDKFRKPLHQRRPQWKDRSGITVIRPLSYLREHEIKKGITLTGFTPLASRCPLDCTSQRAVVKNLLRELTRDNRFVYANIAAAMRAGRPCELWPAALSTQEKRELNFGAWQYKPRQNAGEEIENE